MKKTAFWSLIFLVCLSTNTWAADFQLDKDHTFVTFKIHHLFSWTQGQFDDFAGDFSYEPGKPETWKASAKIQIASINTRNAQRDNHLKSVDFFDAEKFPVMEFKSTGVREANETSAKLDGLLTIRGVEKPVTLDLTINGMGQDAWGKTRAAFTATTKISRKDFGIVWNKVTEAGNLMVGDEVLITLEVEGLLTEPAPAVS